MHKLSAFTPTRTKRVIKYLQEQVIFGHWYTRYYPASWEDQATLGLSCRASCIRPQTGQEWSELFLPLPLSQASQGLLFRAKSQACFRRSREIASSKLPFQRLHSGLSLVNIPVFSWRLPIIAFSKIPLNHDPITFQQIINTDKHTLQYARNTSKNFTITTFSCP